MKDMVITPSMQATRSIPRGWVILGCALGAWALLTFTLWACSSLFQFIQAAI